MGNPVGSAALDFHRDALEGPSPDLPSVAWPSGVSSSISYQYITRIHLGQSSPALDFWDFHWSELFTKLLPINVPEQTDWRRTIPYP